MIKNMIQHLWHNVYNGQFSAFSCLGKEGIKAHQGWIEPEGTVLFGGSFTLLHLPILSCFNLY